MAKNSAKRNCSKVIKTPLRPYEAARLDQELKLCGEYGLRCKREIWRSQLTLARIRKAARQLLTMDEDDTKRIFEGDALLRRMVRYGLLAEDEMSLDNLLLLTTQQFLERRLSDQGLQERTCQVHPPRTRIDQAETHPSGQEDGKCRFFHGSSGIRKAHCFHAQLRVRTGPRRPEQEKEDRSQVFWRGRR